MPVSECCPPPGSHLPHRLLPQTGQSLGQQWLWARGKVIRIFNFNGDPGQPCPFTLERPLGNPYQLPGTGRSLPPKGALGLRAAAHGRPTLCLLSSRCFSALDPIELGSFLVRVWPSLKHCVSHHHVLSSLHPIPRGVLGGVFFVFVFYPRLSWLNSPRSFH